jgi:5-methylthioadenosine/S-adenosylhomocysteine deaminase
MTPVDTVIECRWVVPVRPGGALEHHAIAIDQGKIAALLPIELSRRRFQATRRVELPNHIVTPGLVNAHTHAAMSLFRGIGDDLPLMRWLNERIWPLEKALVSEEFVYDGSRLAALEMLRSGVTCCSDMYFYPHAAARGMRNVGMRTVVGIIAVEFPSAYATDADDYLRKGLAAHDEFRDDPLTSFTLAPHAPYTVADATFERIGMLAEELDLPVHLHLHETRHEIEESLAQFGVRPLQRLERLGLVNERLIAVHAVHVSEGEMRLLAERGVSVVHCPSSNLKLASGIAPITQMRQAAIPVCLGTDGAASNNRLDLLGEMRLAALLAKGASGDASSLPASEALECATIRGADALGLGQKIGTIETGKEADLAAFDLSSPEESPCFEPVSHIVYASGRNAVSDVWVAGRHVVRTRQVVAEAGQELSGVVLMPVPAWQNRCWQYLK